MTLNEFVERAEASLNQYVDEGTDQQLFIAGYLHGHFSLVVSRVETLGAENGLTILETLDVAMRNSLQDAFDNNELELNDQKDVVNMWEGLYQPE